MVEDNSLNVHQEYEVLGYSVRLRPDFEGQVNASRVTQLIEEEAKKIKDMTPHLERGELALLTALKLAADRLALEDEYQGNVARLNHQVKEALQFISEAIPDRQ